MSGALREMAAAVLDPSLAGSPFGERHQVDRVERPEEDDSAPWPEATEALQLLWCAPSTEVARDLPGLWSQVRHHDPEMSGCIDVTVDLDVLGRLVGADVEAVELAALLAGVGDREAAAAAAQLPGLAAEVAVPALADLFERLLVAAR